MKQTANPQEGHDDRIKCAEAFAENRYRRYRWDRQSILDNVPEGSGIYGLFGALWIYVDEADDLQAAMLAKLVGYDPRLARYRPSGFAFELVPREQRVKRCAELIEQLQPLCQRKGSES